MVCSRNQWLWSDESGDDDTDEEVMEDSEPEKE